MCAPKGPSHFSSKHSIVFRYESRGTVHLTPDYFNGLITAQEAANIIQSSVTIYLAEQS